MTASDAFLTEVYHDSAERLKVSLSIEATVKEWLKSGNHDLLDVLQARQENFIRRCFPNQRSFVERYVAGAMCLHARIFTQVIGGDVEGYCFNITAADGLWNKSSVNTPVFRCDHKTDTVIVDAGNQYGSVLVHVTQVVKDEQGVLVAKSILSEARLEVLDKCPCWGRNAPHQVAFPIFCPTSGIGVNREFGSDAFTFGHIVNGITDDCAEVNRGVGVFVSVNQPSTLSISFRDNKVFCVFKKGQSFLGEGVDVNLCSIHLGKLSGTNRREVG